VEAQVIGVSPQVIVAACLSTIGFFSAAWAQDISGCYERSMGVHGDFHLGETLVISRKGSSELDFHIGFVGANGHLCTARGVAMRTRLRKDLRYIFERSEGESPEFSQTGSPSPACTLELVVGSKSISARAIAGDCHSYFMCGARAGVEVTVPRKSKKKLGSTGCALPAS
jgi:hypothetical protein